MKRALASRAAMACLILFASGCDLAAPPATPHPKLVQVMEGSSAWQVTLVDPAELANAPIQQPEAIRRATAGMSSTGTVVAWSVRIEMRDGQGQLLEPRAGWAVLRGDARDPDLRGGEFGFDVAIIDALTGERIQPAGPDLPPQP